MPTRRAGQPPSEADLEVRSPASGAAGEDAQPGAELPRGLYDELAKFETLDLAYAQVAKAPRDFGVDADTLATVERQGVEQLLGQLCDDLGARRYHPGRPSGRSSGTRAGVAEPAVALRDAVVRAAIGLVLGPVFAPELPCDPDPDKAIQWVGGAIDRGLTRVLALTIQEGADADQQQRLLQRAGQRVGDREMLALLEEVLAAPGPPPAGPFARLLGDIACAGIDRVLEETRAIGRDGAVSHVKCARLGTELIVLVDPGPRYDWVLPAVRKRVCEELADLKYQIDHDKTQVVDLALGDRLRFLGHELHRPRGRGTTPAVVCKRIAPPACRQRQSAPGRSGLAWLIHPFLLARSWLGSGGDKALARAPRNKGPAGADKPEESSEGAEAYEPGGTPASGPAIRRPSFSGASPLAQAPRLVTEACQKAASIRVGWRHLPLPLYPPLAILLGWNSWPAWLCLLLLVALNARACVPLLRHARRRWREVAVGVCGLAGLAALYPMACDVWARLSLETAAPGMPAGFALGRYSWSWDADPVEYGLYVPPEFQSQPGPFPLVVYLHGHGDRFKDKVLVRSLPRAIVRDFGPDKPNGSFPFVAFFPIDPSGRWQAGTDEVDGAMKALDHVIRRHHIDPARIYLTGLSVGGSGVWGLAEAYPEKWAALAALSSLYSPDLRKLRPVPVRIYAGGRDEPHLVESQRHLARQLKEANLDVTYTELPDKGHDIWSEVYSSRELFDWFAQKRKD
jgi:predicted esterase